MPKAMCPPRVNRAPPIGVPMSPVVEPRASVMAVASPSWFVGMMRLRMTNSLGPSIAPTAEVMMARTAMIATLAVPCHSRRPSSPHRRNSRPKLSRRRKLGLLRSAMAPERMPATVLAVVARAVTRPAFVAEPVRSRMTRGMRM